MDIFGPNNFIPFHCYSADTTKKFESPIIGYIDNGNEITDDVVQQLQQVFKDQQFIKTLALNLDEFLEQLEALLNPLKLLGLVGSEDEEEEAETEKALQEELELQPFSFS